jgi:putative ABC transport system ATP-binding protein
MQIGDSLHDLSSEGKEAIVLQGVGKSYSRGEVTTHVLDAIDLTVMRGECVFLMGPSGCGKTTLLSIMGCVLSPDRGSVNLFGLDPKTLDNRALANLRLQHLGFVFQRYHLIRGLTALENIGVPLTLSGWPANRVDNRARQLLSQVGLADKASSQPWQLSIGQCQRIALARALAVDPGLVLADEPTAALDAKTGQQAMKLLLQLTTEVGKTAVVVTHDERILSYADRVLRLEAGQLTEEFPSNQRQQAIPIFEESPATPGTFVPNS